MTISTVASQATFLGNGVTTVFSFDFIADSADDVQVIYTNASGAQTTLTSTQYTLVINPPATGQIWGVGGTVTYPLMGSPIANGTSLTVQRALPLTQTTSISNQGDFAPQVIEAALDTLCMEIQQVSARTGQFRGPWVSGASYTIGDLVQDGANGSNTGNYYLCLISNVGTTWTSDLAAGDWGLAITVGTLSLPLPVSAANGGTGQSSYTVGDTLYASTTTALSKLAAVALGKALISKGTGTAPAWGVPYGALLNVQQITSSGTYTPTAGTRAALIIVTGGGGGGAGSGTGAPISGFTGGTTSLGTIAVATGGTGGINGVSTGIGGTPGIGTTGNVLVLSGQGGAGYGGLNAAASGPGGSSFWGGGAQSVGFGNAGVAGSNYGGGGSGGGSGSTFGGAAAGAGGGTAIAYATNISGTYTATIGAAGAAGSMGTSGFVGGPGAPGVIFILEFA